ncbi:MAG: tRNA pseudouridine(38-40) synthase TruA [Flavobacteriales bacterium]|nr:tRNA pseudouridine(38-40) synthase TruA [Flavobacteriales bacterium]
MLEVLSDDWNNVLYKCIFTKKMVRYFIELSYLGDNYCGWQIQPNGMTVQKTVEKALSTILRSPIKITGQGRTDSGVHALKSFAHFDVSGLQMETELLVFKLNSLLPFDISIHNIVPVSDEAHARFSALSRSYRYIYCLRKNPFYHKRSWHIFKPLNLELMNSSTGYILGTHDFTSFSSAKSDTENRICMVKQFEFTQENDFIYLDITADRFVMNMVRTLAGTFAEIGLGKRLPEELPALLESKNRQTTGENAPPYGLYLKDVKYPEHIFGV